MECGIGGHLDATNIIDEPVCSVITSLGFDHQDVLGDTLDDIASEKSGVMLFKGTPHLVMSLKNGKIIRKESFRKFCGMGALSLPQMVPLRPYTRGVQFWRKHLMEV